MRKNPVEQQSAVNDMIPQSVMLRQTTTTNIQETEKNKKTDLISYLSKE